MRMPRLGETREDFIKRLDREDEAHMTRERRGREEASRQMGNAMGYEYESQEHGGDGWSAWG